MVFDHTIQLFLLNAHAPAEPTSLMDQLLHSNVFNFLIALAFLTWAFKKFNLGQFVVTKQAQIEQEVRDAEAKRQQALKELEEIRKRTERLNDEVDEILKTAKASAETMTQQMLQSAQQESAKILQAASRRVELEERTALKSIEQRLLNDVLHETRETLAQSMTKKDQERSVETFLEELSEYPVAAQKGGQA